MDVLKVKKFAEEKLKDCEDWAHSFSHVKEMLRLLDDFFEYVDPSEIRGVNKEVLYKAAILHDIWRKEKEGHAMKSVEIMKTLPLKEDEKEKIAKVILEHDYPKSKSHEIKTTEGKILWDIDNLEANGYIGLIKVQSHAKCFGKDLKWALEEWRNFWYASPENMHFKYTKKLMEAKKLEEKRYLEILEN